MKKFFIISATITTLLLIVSCIAQDFSFDRFDVFFLCLVAASGYLFVPLIAWATEYSPDAIKMNAERKAGEAKDQAECDARWEAYEAQERAKHKRYDELLTMENPTPGEMEQLRILQRDLKPGLFSGPRPYDGNPDR